MKKSPTARLMRFLLCLSLTVALAACDRQGGNTPGTTAPSPSRRPESSTENKTEPSPEKRAPYSRTWIHTEYFADKEWVYRIILDRDGSAQLVVQDGVGNLIDLSGGSWSLQDDGRLTLDLVSTRINGEELAEGKTIPLGGAYSAVLKNDGSSLTLGVTENASELAPAQKDGPVVFYDERYTPEKLEMLCRAVLNYYTGQNGEPYPGRAMVHEIGPDGVLIHLGEDMGDHIATAGWYLINPDTLQGSDEILGGAIDFSSYMN